MKLKNNKDILIIFGSFILLSGISLFIPINYLINFAHDDSFFYLKIAQNIVNGSGITFDSISTTNGFHPLYLILITSLFFFIKPLGVFTPEHQYNAVFIIHLILIHITIIVTLKIFKLKLPEKYYKYGAAIFIIFCLSFVFIRDFGLESHLACLLISIFILNSINEIKTRKHIIYNSLLISGLFLIRTDYLLTLIPFLILSDYFNSDKRIRLTSVISDILILLIISLTYYLINYFYWGNFQTISSIIVNSFPSSALTNNVKIIFSLNSKLLNQGIRLFLLLLMVFLFIFKREKTKIELLLLYIAYGLLLNSILHLYFNNYGLREWYLTLPSFIIGIMFVLLLKEKINIIKYSSLTIFIILFVVMFYFSRIIATKWDGALEYSYYLKKHIKNEDIIYQFDNAGIISYFSNRNVIDGDGLVNSFEYLEYLKNKNIYRYLIDKKVKYLSTINYKNDFFEQNDIYKFSVEEALLSNIILKKSDLIYQQFFIHKHIVGYFSGYFLLFNLMQDNH